MTDGVGSRHPRPRVGIRARVVVGYVTLLAAALAISLFITREVLLSRLDREIARATTQEVEELRRLAAAENPETGEPFGVDAAAIFRAFMTRSVPGDDEAYYSLVDGAPFLRSFNAPASLFDDAALVERWKAATTPSHTTETTEAGTVRWLAVPLASGDDILGTFVIVHFPGPQRQKIAQNLRVLLVTGGIVLAASAVLAWTLAGRVLRPVGELTATAQEISESDLSRRIPVSGNDELAELGRTFNEMLDRLEGGFDDQRRFLDDVAHELRTPITIAQGHLDLLGHDPAEQDETKAIITDELERMNRYVNDLLLLARAERPDFLRLGPVDLGDFADTTLRALTPLADRDWRLDTAPTPGRDIVTADERRLSQAIINLASNATEHTSPGDTIALGATIDRTSAPTLQLWIRDTGTGIAPDVATSLFDRHARGGASRGTRPEGMGIGLAIVDAIARAHGGSVDAHSEPGAGAQFTLSLPLHDALGDLLGDPESSSEPVDTEEAT